MANSIPTFNGKLRNHRLDVPKCIDRCSGITIFGRNLKSFVFRLIRPVVIQESAFRDHCAGLSREHYRVPSLPFLF